MAGNPGDFGDLAQSGYRFALSLTHDATKADDLIQDAWFAILRARGPWNRKHLFATVRNRFIDLYRRDKTTATEPLDSHPEPAGVSEPHLWNEGENVFASNGTFDRALGRLRRESGPHGGLSATRSRFHYGKCLDRVPSGPLDYLGNVGNSSFREGVG